MSFSLQIENFPDEWIERGGVHRSGMYKNVFNDFKNNTIFFAILIIVVEHRLDSFNIYL